MFQIILYRPIIFWWSLAFMLLPQQSIAKRRIPSWTFTEQQKIQTEIVQQGRSHSDKKRQLVQQQQEAQYERNISTRNDLPLPNDHLVTDLPYLPYNLFPTKHYAGHIPASLKNDKKLFYWLFLPDGGQSTAIDPESDIPLIIWLNGGPGCSSMDGLWIENGPFRLVPPQVSGENDWSIEINPFSWHTAPAYVLYVDQPVGTGLSFTKMGNYCKNDLEINIDFHMFLENFMLVYKDFFLMDKEIVTTDDNGKEVEQYRMKRPLYFSGESHAGHYIPSMMDYILKKNEEKSSNTIPLVKFNLKGGAIGNGWVDPFYQYSASDIAYGVGLIDLAQKEELDKRELECRKDLKDGNLDSAKCFDLLSDVIHDSAGKNANKKVSVYDNRFWEKRTGSRDFPPGHKYVERYLGGWTGADYPSDMRVNYKDVLKALHADESISAKQRFEECTDPPYNALAYQDGLGVRDEVVAILSHPDKPRLLFFNGINDMICNHVGNEKLLDNLPWAYQKDWTLAARYAWDPLGESNSGLNEPAGYMKQFDNLLFLKVMSSGHMVPMDVPDIALEMIKTFVYSQSFEAKQQRLNRGIPASQNCDDLVQTCSCPVCDEESQHNTDIVNNGSSSMDHDGTLQNSAGSIGDMNSSKSMGNFPNGMLLGGIIGIVLTLIVGKFWDRRGYCIPKRKRVFDKDDMEALHDDIPQTEII